MTLRIYENVGDNAPYSVGSLYTNPLIFSFDGRIGGTLKKRLYLRNTDASYTYSSITIEPENTGTLDVTGKTTNNGFLFKLKSGDTQPSDDEWDTIAAGNQISMSNISDTVTYLPFWVYVKVPNRVSSRHIRTISLLITAEQA